MFITIHVRSSHGQSGQRETDHRSDENAQNKCDHLCLPPFFDDLNQLLTERKHVF
jgi:hypothetical protein